MRNNNHADRGFFVTAIALVAGAGLVVMGLGTFTELPAIRAVGLVVMVITAVLALALAAYPVFAFLAFLDWIGLLPVSRFIGWLKERCEQAEQRSEKRAGPEVLIENQYRFFAARKAPVAEPRDLRRVVSRLIRKIQHLGDSGFTLYGYTPAMEKRRVMRFGFSSVGYFLEHSEIRWNFGREHSDPTHELLFFSRFNGTHAVYLRISFVSAESNATCPGLFAELRLTPAALGVDDTHLASQIERFFRALVETLDADFGHVELPGQPECENWPSTPGSGAFTFTANAPATVADTPTASIKPCGRGSLVVAWPESHLENFNLCEQS